MAQLKDTLRTDLTTAMKAREAFRTQVLRMTLAAIQTEEVSGTAAHSLSDAEELAVVTRELRKRKESAEAFADGGRPELAAKETAEAELLSAYLPAGLSEAEVDAIVAEEVANLAEPSMKDMGRLMKAINARIQGRADGGTVAAKVKAVLA